MGFMLCVKIGVLVVVLSAVGTFVFFTEGMLPMPVFGNSCEPVIVIMVALCLHMQLVLLMHEMFVNAWLKPKLMHDLLLPAACSINYTFYFQFSVIRTAQMKKIQCCICVLLINLCLLANCKGQTKGKHSIFVDGSLSMHGSGDYYGYMLHAGYQRAYTNRLSVRYLLGVTTNGISTLSFNSFPGALLLNPRFPIVTGAQANALLVFHATGARRQYFNVLVGPLLRYQYNRDYDPTAGGSAVGEPARTQNIGYRVQLESLFIQTRKTRLGIQTGFQNDTNADVILNLGLVFCVQL